MNSPKELAFVLTLRCRHGCPQMLLREVAEVESRCFDSPEALARYLGQLLAPLDAQGIKQPP